MKTTRYTMLLILTVWMMLLSPPNESAFADSIRAQEWIVSALDLITAHRYSEGAGVVVAVIDSGVDITHADLAGNVLSGTDVSGGTPKGDGHIDTNGHGTGMAGLIAGHGHGSSDGDGVIGIAPQAKVLPVRESTTGAGGYLGEAVRWAILHGAGVVSISIAAKDDPDLKAAVSAAEAANIVVVAGAGNTTQGATSVAYPAAYPGVVAAAGTDEKGNHASVSVIGSQVVLAAPATNVVEPYPGHRYAIGTGTSASTAIIAGAAALVRSRYPNLSAAEVIHRLTATAIDKGPPGRDDEYGYGLINIVAALTANVPPLSASSSVAPSSSTSTPALTTPPASATTTANRSTSHGNPRQIIALIAAILLVIAVFLVARRTIRRE